MLRERGGCRLSRVGCVGFLNRFYFVLDAIRMKAVRGFTLQVG